jgi:hypothetical protein
VRYVSFHCVVKRGAEEELSAQRSDERNRFVRERDGPGHRDHAPILGADEGVLVGEEPEPAVHEARGERALSRAGMGRQEQCPAASLHDTGVNHEVLVGAVRNTPVEAPLEERRRELVGNG